MPHVALSLMPTDDFREAALPLFAEGRVDALEWSFEMETANTPTWAVALLDHYGSEGRLYAHGVHFSVLSAEDLPHHAHWLARAADACARRPYVHISEHVGFMLTRETSRGAPLPVPATPAVAEIGSARLSRLAEATQLPVGLENLALALTPRDVFDEGPFLEQVLAPVDGFLVLDLHNLWCRAHNFGQDPYALMMRYPLARVRELHLSGGSWDPEVPTFRRDTHDGPVPDPLWPLLTHALEACPAVELVVLERLGGTLNTPAEQVQFRDDFRTLRKHVHG